MYGKKKYQALLNSDLRRDRPTDGDSNCVITGPGIVIDKVDQPGSNMGWLSVLIYGITWSEFVATVHLEV